MAASIPAKLKQAGITPFVIRAAQLEKARPVISYWCEYWVVNQILSKQLHSADEECLQFTTTLMDKLEQTKEKHAGNDAILDDTAGQAYVEQFAQETFERADRTLKANKVSQQTAITFEAASTFFQLINIWQIPDAETQKKIKFSKWNAARILKAIKEGKDPNESNPTPEEAKTEETPALDPNDPEVLALGQPRPVTVEEVPDEDRKTHLEPRASVGDSHYSPVPVSAPTSPPQGSAPAPEQVSPIVPPDQSMPDSYFSSAPSGPAGGGAGDGDLQLPSAPGMEPGSPNDGAPSPPTTLPSLGPSAPSLPDTPQNFYRPTAPSVPSQPPPGAAPTPPVLPPQQHQPYQPPVNNYSQQPPPSQPVAPTTTFSPPPQLLPPAQPASSYSGAPPTNSVYVADEVAMMQAQKHAKWAISALNFEDVPTAVRELKAALQTLGAGQ
ncbi:Vta1 like-domain-containing protein [Pseudomassariella vexata]|uniref:Vta1 like-domain-containing protein n=1 Tax=Pseudomassariella vexata TaxID=1141098 RepID=A0A1Y2DB75_9PEZI|nr:Vta1 like-domain-containing protein [Pseudomassariella vexata]ORY55915.1 Vta1 like-domain-containing protein [Pseudomassariella vexata]